MQIRQLSLKELEEIYPLIQKLYPLSYGEFEDLIYEMREEYIMLGIFDEDELVCFSGVKIVTSLQHKRHLQVLDFTTKEERYETLMLRYLKDYAKTAMCQKILFFEENGVYEEVSF